MWQGDGADCAMTAAVRFGSAAAGEEVLATFKICKSVAVVCVDSAY